MGVYRCHIQKDFSWNTDKPCKHCHVAGHGVRSLTASLTLAKGVMDWPFRKQAPESSDKGNDWGFYVRFLTFSWTLTSDRRMIYPAHLHLSTVPLCWSKHTPASGTRFPAASFPASALAQLFSPSGLKTRSTSQEPTCPWSLRPQPDWSPVKTAPLGSSQRGGCIRDTQRGSVGN